MNSLPSYRIDGRSLAGAAGSERKPFGASVRCLDAGAGTRGDVS